MHYTINPVQKKTNKNTTKRIGRPKSAKLSTNRNSLLFFSGGIAHANFEPALTGIFTDASLAACLRIRTNCVWRATSAKGMNKVKSIQMSIIFSCDVLGKLLETPMNKVIMTSSAVRLTVTTASKYSIP